MTREEAIAKSIEMYPVFILGNIVDVNEQIRAAYMRGFDDVNQTKERMTKTREQIEQISLDRYPAIELKRHGGMESFIQRKAFIEGYTLCQEEEQGRNDLIQELKDKIAAIPEGETGECFLAKVLTIIKELK